MKYVIVLLLLLMVCFSTTKADNRLVFGEYLQSQLSGKSWTIGYDIDKLAKAVAMHETKNCGLNYGSSAVNNCFGIMTWKNGNRQFKKFNNEAESYGDFKRIWTTHYRKFPTIVEAKKYSGNDRADIWLSNVRKFYFAS